MQTDKRSYVLWRNTGLHMVFSTLLLAVLLTAGTAQAGMYRWVDGNGRVHYSDTLPSTYQKSGAAEMSKQGLVIKRTQSEAERRAEGVQLEEERLAEQARQQQAQQDRALTLTYTTEAEIDLARDRALEHHNMAIKGTQLRAKIVADNLAELQERAARLIKAGRPIPPNLKEQLDQVSKESLELRRSTLNHEEALMKVRVKYDTDKLRFRELTRK
ncbi:MAG: DUF4124 domain-containing protein [Thiobacillus sp.]